MRRLRLNVLEKFTVLSVAVTAILVAGLGLLVSHILTANLLEQEGRVTADAIRTITDIDLPADAFRRAVRENDSRPFEYIWQHLSRISEAFRLKVYDIRGRIVWANEPLLIGKVFPDNEELREALRGSVEVEIGKLKAEHALDTPSAPETEILEIYVPLRAPEDGRIYGVVEIYRHPAGFWATRRLLRRGAWIAGLTAGLLLFFSLFTIFRGALKEQMRLQAIEREYAGIEVEMKLAGAIQRDLLPPILPVVPGVDLAASHRPCREIGGDYYDFLRAQDGSVAMVVADSEGKGIPGALLMAQTRSLLRSHLDGASGAAAVLSAANRALADGPQPARFATVFLARLAPETRVLTHSSAGHWPALHLRDGRVETLEAGGLPLGVEPETAYEEGRLLLAPGDALLFYTDGVVDTFDPAGERFGLERVQGVWRAQAGRSAAEALAAVSRAVDDFRADRAQSDDITLVCLVVAR